MCTRLYVLHILASAVLAINALTDSNHKDVAVALNTAASISVSSNEDLDIGSDAGHSFSLMRREKPVAVGIHRVQDLGERSGTQHHGHEKVAMMVLAMPASSPEWHDAFAVFAYSARKAFAKSRFALDLLAITDISMGDKERDMLEGVGFQVLRRPLPVPKEKVRQEYARDMMTKGCGQTNGCDHEMLKLYGVALTNYSRVMICDSDLLMLQGFDDLLTQDDNLMLATYDHELDGREFFGFTNKYSAIPMVNGGFLVLKPSSEDFKALVDTALEGDFRDGSGWKGMRVGWGFGGIGPQGLFAYHYNKEALELGEQMIKAPDLAKNMTISPASSRIRPLDRSVYDVIATDDLRDAVALGSVASKDVKVFHFTGKCQKPWVCYPLDTYEIAMCKDMTDKWWSLRSEAAFALGLTTGDVPDRCPTPGEYKPFSPNLRH